MGTIRRPGSVPNLMPTCYVIIDSVFVPIFGCGGLLFSLPSLGSAAL